MTVRYMILAGLVALGLGACSQAPSQKPASAAKGQIGDYKVGQPYEIGGVWYYPSVNYRYRDTGIASWYGPGFDGKRTANGEIYDQSDMTAAHRTLPMPSLVQVTNLENGRSVKVRINDRGPFKNGRIIDLSERAATLLGFTRQGTAKVRVEVLEPESRQLAAIAQRGDAAARAPKAAPMVAVTQVPLEPDKTADGGGSDAPAPRLAALAPPSRTAKAGSGWLLEDESGAVETLRGASRPTAAGTPWPDNRVSVVPVLASDIYVQAGSFLRRDFATRMSARLSGLGRSNVSQVTVGDRRYFRVRLGPVATVDEADRLLETLLARGVGDARVVVD